MRGAEKSLFLAGYGDKDDGGGKAKFGERAGAFERDGHAGGVIVGAGSVAGGIGPVFEDVGVDGVVMACDEDDVFFEDRVRAGQNGVNVGQLGGLDDAAAWAR